MSPNEMLRERVAETPQPRNVHDLLQDAAVSVPDAAAMIAAGDGSSMSYTSLVETVSDIASALVAGAPATRARPRIGLVLPNGLPLSVALLASALAGEATPFNPALTLAEYERYFRATRIEVLVLSNADNGPAETAAAALDVPVFRLTADLKIAGVTGTSDVPPPDPEDIALVLMTSGSTGVPKIVPLSHRNVCRSAQDVARSLALGPQDRCLVMWQQFHIGGLVDLLLAPLSAGGTLILTDGFDAAGFYDLRARHAPTWFQGVPTTLGELLVHAERHGIPPGPGSLRLLRSVAAALSPALQAKLEAFFDVPVVRTLGMTEAGPLITSTALPPAVDKSGSVGRSCGPEIRILGKDGAVLETGMIGDIAVRGENVFSGYEANPEANAAAFRDGWFLTGDTGRLDADGDLFLTGRVSEQINRGGYKIMPAEVEEALSRHADVREAAVFGLAHATLGEDIAAAVTLTPGTQTDAAALRAHLSELLAANKVPSRILVRDALPRNPVGKVDRLALALEAAEGAGDDAVLVAPRNPTERLLAELWRQELELPEVGVRQDFMMIGGDSLSALRVIVALERAFACPMPDAVVENLTTIEEIAQRLDEAGIALPEQGAGTAPGDPEPERTENAKIAEVPEDDVADALRRVSGKAELDLAIRQVTVYRTPAQIADLLPAISPRCIARGDAPVWQRARLGWRFVRKRKEILDEIRAGGDAARLWTRRELAPSATLYSAPDRSAWQKTLVAGFSGNGQGMSTEMYRFLIPLDPERFDFVLLRDTARQDLYLGGLPEMGDSILKLGAWLEEFADAEGYAGRMALGTSGGGLAAIHTGLAYGWDRVVTMSPPRLSKHRGYAPLIAELGAASLSDHPSMLIANGDYAKDIDAVRQLLEHLPFAEHDFHADCTKHNILNFARETGRLEPLYARWFDMGAARP